MNAASLNTQHVQAIVASLKMEYDERLRFMGENIDAFLTSLSPFFDLVFQQSPTDLLRWECCKSACISCSEAGIVSVERGARSSAREILAQEIAWTQRMFGVLGHAREISLYEKTVKHVFIHANHYRTLQLDDEALRLYRLVDATCHAVELIGDCKNLEHLASAQLEELILAAAMLEYVGHPLLAAAQGFTVGSGTFPAGLTSRMRTAQARVQAFWEEPPSVNKTAGTTREAAYSFLSRRAAESWVKSTPCPSCNAQMDAKSLLTPEMELRTDPPRAYVVHRPRCSRCTHAITVYCDALSYPGVRALLDGLTTASYIYLARKLVGSYDAVYEDEHDDGIQSWVEGILRSLVDAMGGGDVDLILSPASLKVCVVRGMYREGPLCRRCKDGAAIILPMPFITRMFRFARFFARTWGVGGNDGVIIAEPVIRPAQAQQLMGLLTTEFWAPLAQPPPEQNLPTDILPQMEGMVEQFVRSCVTFVLAHELAHIVLQCPSEGVARSISLDEYQHGPQPTQALGRERQVEIAADLTAVHLLGKVLEKETNDASRSFSLASIDIFFTLLTLIEHRYPPRQEIHPIAYLRRAALRSSIGSCMTTFALSLALGVELTLESIAPPLKVEPLPEILRGNWQMLESGLSQLLRHNHEGAQNDILTFVVCDPLNAEGWDALWRLHGQGSALLMPMGALKMTVNEIEGRITVNVVDKGLLLDDPVASRKKDLWTEYVRRLLDIRAEVRGMSNLSLEQEVSALDSWLSMVISRSGCHILEYPFDHLVKIREKGLLKEFVYFARYSAARPGFGPFREHLLKNKRRVIDLVECLSTRP